MGQTYITSSLMFYLFLVSHQTKPSTSKVVFSCTNYIFHKRKKQVNVTEISFLSKVVTLTRRYHSFILRMFPYKRNLPHITYVMALFFAQKNKFYKTFLKIWEFKTFLSVLKKVFSNFSETCS